MWTSTEKLERSSFANSHGAVESVSRSLSLSLFRFRTPAHCGWNTHRTIISLTCPQTSTKEPNWMCCFVLSCNILTSTNHFKCIYAFVFRRIGPMSIDLPKCGKFLIALPPAECICFNAISILSSLRSLFPLQSYCSCTIRVLLPHYKWCICTWTQFRISVLFWLES